MNISDFRFETDIEYSEAQRCFTRDVWYGDTLLAFYSTNRARLGLGLLSIAAECMKSLGTPEAVYRLTAPLHLIGIHWEDFRPAVCIPMVGHQNVMMIPMKETPDA